MNTELRGRWGEAEAAEYLRRRGYSIVGMYGSDVFYQDAMDALGPDAFGFGIDDAKLEIVGAPTLDDMKLGDDKTLTYTFTVELYPEAVLGQYKELELEKDKPEVTDEQLSEQLESVRKRNARMGKDHIRLQFLQ